MVEYMFDFFAEMVAFYRSIGYNEGIITHKQERMERYGGR